jgi:acyl-homoserine-lactone acylase
MLRMRGPILFSRALAIAFLIVVAGSFAAATAPTSSVGESAAAERMARATTIYRDAYGVPHVYGQADPECVFGYIYAQCEDNFWQIEDGYIRALGRASEVYGEKTLSEDLLTHALELPARAQEQYRQASPKIREICDATALALNYYVSLHSQVKPRVITYFEPWHVMAFVLYQVYEEYVIAATGQDLNVPRLQPRSAEQKAALGSNAWAIGPSKSATGHCHAANQPAYLFLRPHPIL